MQQKRQLVRSVSLQNVCSEPSGKELAIGKTKPRSKLIPRRSSLPLIVYVGPFLIVLLVALTLTRNRTNSFFGRHDINLLGVRSIRPMHVRRSASKIAVLNEVSNTLAAINASRLYWPRHKVTGALQNEVWESVKDDVAIGIKTGHEVSQSRLNALRTSGWWSVGRDVPNFAIMSDMSDSSLGIVSVKQYGLSLLQEHVDLSKMKKGNSSWGFPIPILPFGSEEDLRTAHMTGANSDGKVGYGGVSGVPFRWFSRSGWRGDKDKNLPAFHVLRTAFPNKKWYVLLDDDTYIFLENFARFILQQGMDEEAVYTGKVFYISRCGGFERDGAWKANKTEPRGLFAHGGSGIVINGLAMERLFPAIVQCMRDYTPCWAGDMQLGLCLRRTGVMIRRNRVSSFDRHFVPFCPSKALADRRYSARWKSDDEPVTFHKIDLNELKLVSEFERLTARKGDTVVYSELRRFIMRHGVLPRHTAKERKNRFFSTEFLPNHLKQHIQKE